MELIYSLVSIGVGIGIYFLTRYFSNIKKQKIEKGETVQAKIISLEDVIRNIRTATRVGTKHWDMMLLFLLHSLTALKKQIIFDITLRTKVIKALRLDRLKN